MSTTTKTPPVLTAFTVFNTMDSISESLGITPERTEEIHQLLKGYVKDANDKITYVLDKIENNTDLNINERAYATWAFGHGMGVNEDEEDDSHEGFGDQPNPLAEMLVSFCGGNGDDLGTEGNLEGDDELGV